MRYYCSAVLRQPLVEELSRFDTWCSNNCITWPVPERDLARVRCQWLDDGTVVAVAELANGLKRSIDAIYLQHTHENSDYAMYVGRYCN